MRKFLVLAVLGLAACGGGGSNSINGSGEPQSPVLKSAAETSDVQWEGSEPGITPFIAFVDLAGQNLSDVLTISYVVEPKPGSISKPVRVTYTMDALRDRGRLESDSLLHLPVFGLYAGYANDVSIKLNFVDCSTQTLSAALTTAAYTDPNGVYDNPVFIKTRAAGSELGFDFFMMKSGFGTPIVVDTDGAIRWVGVSSESSISSIFTDNGFVIGDQRSLKMRRLELDGSEVSTTLVAPNYRRFHHNIDPGKTGLLGEWDTFTDRETTIGEFTFGGGLSKEWDFAAIVRDYMSNAGDDPSLFVRPGVDWFHTNAAVYDGRDDSLVVSSRENFIMNVDYETGAIRWVLGDPTKYWSSFPSLRAKALTLESGLYPIGQHSLSITSDGLLLTFNAGNASESQPAGAPLGESRTYSAVSAYRIDAETMTATEVWNFDYGQSLYSDHCSSVYEAPGQSILIAYARVDNRQFARLVALNKEHEVVFDIQYASGGCNTSWNAVPVPFEDLSFM